MLNHELIPGQVLAGRYRVERLLGSGGMGVVVAARHVELDQRVAVKVLRADLASNRTFAERFRREARAACKVTSPHGARVLDVGTTEGGLPFLVMEYLEGHDLAEELDDRGRLPIEEAARYVIQAADAIAEAHGEGIVHRDLKPANLFLSERAGGRSVKVLDFGISKSLSNTTKLQHALTRTEGGIGSPMYMSPEQLDTPREVDERTDIWSLGVVLFELVSGQAPFKSEGLAGLVKKIVNEPPPSLASLGVKAPPGFEAVLLRCLEKDREQRFTNVDELAQELSRFTETSPLSSRRVPIALLPVEADAQRDSEERLTPPTGARRSDTLIEWGGTGHRPKQRSLAPWAVGAVATVLAAGIGVWSLGGVKGARDFAREALHRTPPQMNGEAEPEEPSTSLAVPATALPEARPSSAAPATPPRDVPALERRPETPPPEAVAVPPEAVAVPPEAVAVPPEADSRAAARTPDVAPPPRLSKPKRPPPVAAQPEPARSDTNAPERTLTDFGGRR